MIQKLATLLRRVVIGPVDDAKAVQQVQAQHAADRASDGVEHFQPFGLHFVPSPGAEGILAAIAGSTANAVVLGVVDRRNAPPTGSPAGCGGLYNAGMFRVYLTAGGEVVLAGDSDSGRAATDAVAIAGKVLAELEALQATVDSLVTAHNTHVHLTTATVAATPTPGVISPTATQALPPAAVGDVASSTVLIPGEA